MGFKQLKVRELLLLSAFLIALTSAQTLASTTNSYNFTDTYSAEWYTYIEDGTSNIRLRVVLRVLDVNYAVWSDQGTDGIWLGIGWGATEMVGSDIVMCNFLYSGVSGSTKFQCTDRYASGYSQPVLDSQDDVDDVSTNKLFDTGAQTVTLEATFERKLDTGDANDYYLRDGGTHDAIWGYGQIFSNTPNSHGTSNRDAFRMRQFSVSADNILLCGLISLFSIVMAFTLF